MQAWVSISSMYGNIAILLLRMLHRLEHISAPIFIEIELQK